MPQLDTDAFSDQEIIAKTLWGEARGEGLNGMEAVACIIQNRVASGVAWWGTNPRSVCLAPAQFSCWLRTDPNRKKLIAVTDADPIYNAALGIAEDAAAGSLPDITHGADSYVVTGTVTKWDTVLTPCAVIGKHSFYKTLIKKNPPAL